MSKFKLGDYRYVCSLSSAKEKCPACCGSGEVMLADDINYECPKCSGKGEFTNHKKPEVKPMAYEVNVIITCESKEGKFVYLVENMSSDFSLQDGKLRSYSVCEESNALTYEECLKDCEEQQSLLNEKLKIA